MNTRSRIDLLGTFQESIRRNEKRFNELQDPISRDAVKIVLEALHKAVEMIRSDPHARRF